MESRVCTRVHVPRLHRSLEPSAKTTRYIPDRQITGLASAASQTSAPGVQ